MTAVAIGFVPAVFATAPGHLFLFGDFHHHRTETGAGLGVRTVAIRLFLGITAGTPEFFARFFRADVRSLLSDFRIHDLPPRGIIPESLPEVQEIPLRPQTRFRIRSTALSKSLGRGE